MKNILYLLILLGLFASACKKTADAPSAAEETEREVTFSVSSLTQTVEVFDKSSAFTKAIGDTLKNYAKHLYCRIYPANSVHHYITIIQNADSADFGTIRARLTPGSYTVFFLASNQKLDISQSRYRQDLFRMERAELDYWEDLFYLFRYQISIPDTGTTQASVRLDRLVGAIELNVEDEVPVNASKLSIEVNNDALYYSPFNSTFQLSPSKKEFVISDAQKGKKNQKFLMHILNTDVFPRMGVNIKVYDAANTLLINRKTEIHQIRRNKKTLISGELFAPGVPGDFTITVNTEWSPLQPPIEF